METDIGEPIDYMHSEQEYHQHPSPQQHQYPMHMQMPMPVPIQHVEKIDFFSTIDKTTYIVMFIAFILGFFMGKTMQPVILRN